MAGLLTVRGSIDLSQFWPVGSSDADTSKVRVDVSDNSFRFAASGTGNGKVVHDFDLALVRGKSGRKPIVDPKSRIVVRLQAVDAPELHYRPMALRKPSERTAKQNQLYLEWNYEYRQPLAESATLALVARLTQSAHNNAVACTVRSYGDQPSDFFDTYGRLVGEIFVGNVSINRWLLSRGWAVPAFYNSMSRDEIESATDAADGAYDAGLGVWPSYTDSCSKFSFDLRYRGKGAKVKSDAGQVVVPKIYRRLSAYKVNVKSKMFAGSFRDYLEATPDECYLTGDFLVQEGAAYRYVLLEWIESNRLTMWPEDIVFKDSPSKVVDPGGDLIEW